MAVTKNSGGQKWPKQHRKNVTLFFQIFNSLKMQNPQKNQFTQKNLAKKHRDTH